MLPPEARLRTARKPKLTHCPHKFFRPDTGLPQGTAAAAGLEPRPFGSNNGRA